MKILAIDPGSEKCGYAFLSDHADAASKGIIPTTNLGAFIETQLAVWKPEIVLLGDGTYSRKVKSMILPFLKDVPLLVVDEHDSTYRSRKLYFKENPPRGFWRFIPLGLQVPPEPYDDFAALLIAKRYLESKEVV